jgi:hypothetical protein
MASRVPTGRKFFFFFFRPTAHFAECLYERMLSLCEKKMHRVCCGLEERMKEQPYGKIT